MQWFIRFIWGRGFSPWYEVSAYAAAVHLSHFTYSDGEQGLLVQVRLDTAAAVEASMYNELAGSRGLALAA